MFNKYADFVRGVRGIFGVRCQTVQGKAYVPPRHLVLRQDATIGSKDPANRWSPEARARQGGLMTGPVAVRTIVDMNGTVGNSKVIGEANGLNGASLAGGAMRRLRSIGDDAALGVSRFLREARARRGGVVEKEPSRWAFAAGLPGISRPSCWPS
jgi:hypothetical protein